MSRELCCSTVFTGTNRIRQIQSSRRDRHCKRSTFRCGLPFSIIAAGRPDHQTGTDEFAPERPSFAALLGTSQQEDQMAVAKKKTRAQDRGPGPQAGLRSVQIQEDRKGRLRRESRLGR